MLPQGERIPDPRREGRLGDPEPRGASGWSPRLTLPRETRALSRLQGPSCSAGPAAASRWALGREADPLPQPRGCSEWRVVSGEGGEPRPFEGRLLALQTHVVGLKKLLGSEALAGVRPALAPGRGRADAEAVSSAPLASSPEGPQDSRRTRGTLTQRRVGQALGERRQGWVLGQILGRAAIGGLEARVSETSAGRGGGAGPWLGPRRAQTGPQPAFSFLGVTAGCRSPK